MPSFPDYQPLAQSFDEEREALISNESSHAQSPSVRRTSLRRPLRPGPIDLSKLDAAFKRWTESIAQKVKGKKKVEPDDSRKEILRSVFEPPVPARVVLPGPVKTLDHKAPMTQSEYDGLTLSVQRAISEGIHPKMISKGSSGSYFARAKVDGRVQTVAVFKPKDEEPYGRLNPKTTKWLHRQFRWLIPFGRSCLIPNLSYVSEAAASLLDERLDLHIVPKTQLVSFSSPAFFYDWLDRNAAKKGKPLPEKIGSMQCFMHGYQDASDFLRKYPWPGRSIRDTFDDSTHRKGRFTKRFLSALKVVCGRTGDEDDSNDLDDYDEEQILFDANEDDRSSHPFYWSTVLQQSFREELEKLVILDYIIHNTDRGADNYMIKYCAAEHEKSLVDVAPTRSHSLQMPMMNEIRKDGMLTTPQMSSIASPSTSAQPTLSSSPRLMPSPSVFSSQAPYTRHPHIHIAAIDNSLAFPHEHPKGWRSYTYGWLYLPVSVIGSPFSQKTRDHFLPLLTSKAWWEETTYQLRKLFSVDPDFNRKMFQRQLAVIKGQAWNVVQSLKHHDEGPLELTRRQKVLVWDEEVEVDDDSFAEVFGNGPMSASPKPSVQTLPIQAASHRRARSQSALDARGFPPPMRRATTDARPVPFVSKLPRVHPGTSGVTVLEHMDRVDAVEAGLRRLAMDDSVIVEEDEEEVDVGLRSSSPQPSTVRASEAEREGSVTPHPDVSPILSPMSAPDQPLLAGTSSLASSMTEEDLVAMSKSTSVLEPGVNSPHSRFMSDQPPNGPGRPSLDWIREESSSERKQIMINERIETVNTKALLSCW